MRPLAKRQKNNHKTIAQNSGKADTCNGFYCLQAIIKATTDLKKYWIIHPGKIHDW